MGRSKVAEERREQIIEAASRVLAHEGIAETTTRKITSEAGVNNATLNYYFGSKDDLFYAVLEHIQQHMIEVVRTSIRTDLHFAEAIQSELYSFWSFIEENPDMQMMQYELTLYVLRHPASAWLARQQYTGYFEVAEILCRQAAAQEVCQVPFDELARFIVAGLDGLILQFLATRNSGSAKQNLDHLIRAIVMLATGRNNETK